MIAKIEQKDIPACVRLIRESFRTVADEFGITEENAPRFTAFATTDQRLEYHLNVERRPMFLCRQGEDIIGYYSLAPGEDGCCELNNLCVHPEHRHGGIGRRLLLHSFEQARELGCSTMNIGIVEENRRLRAWYEGFDFVHTGTQKFDFFPFTCGYMRKELREELS